MNKLIDKINELHPVLEYSDYSELMDLAYELQEKYRQLHEATANIPLDRLKEICEEERTAEYSSYQTLDYARERAYIITRNGMNFEAIQGENAKERAEERLKELRGE